MKILMLILAALMCISCSPIVKVNEESVASLEKQQKLTYDKNNYPFKLKNLNSKIELEEQIFEKPPQRVVAVWQNSMETPMALGVGDRLVAAIGLPNDKSLRPEYRDIYGKVAYRSLENLDVETVLMMKPDIIIGWYSTFGAKVLRSTDFWHSRGVNTFIARNAAPTKSFRTLENEFLDILDLGKIFDKEKEAKQIVDSMKQEIAFAKEEAKKLNVHSRALIIEFMGKNIMAYGEKSLAGNIVQNLDGDLLAAKERQISLEQIIEYNPDVIYVIVLESQYGQEDMILNKVYGNKALRGLKAVQNKNVIPLPFYCVYTSGVRSYDGIKIISRGLYPELYKEKN